MSSWEKYLRDIYLDPSHPASFSNPRTLYKAVKKEGKHKISHSQIKKWIQKQESYSRNKSVKRKFQHGRVIVAGIDDQFDADLASLVYYADDNDGYKYLLVVIDIFSQYSWVEPLKDKTASQIVNAFDKILSGGRIPKQLRTDAAKDFTSEKFQTFVRGKNIVHFVTHNEKQANYVERFIKTLKSRLSKYMIEKNTRRYIDVLQKIVTSYNHTWHSGIRSEPVNVNKQNEKQLWWQMYWPKEPYVKKKKKEKIKFAFNVGDRVRTTYIRKHFQCEYDSKWTGEIFKISRRFICQGQPIYTLVDWYDNPVKGTFYQKELQKIETTEADMFKIEKVLKYKGRGNKKEALVHWLGWPKHFDSWIPVSDINKQ